MSTEYVDYLYVQFVYSREKSGFDGAKASVPQDILGKDYTFSIGSDHLAYVGGGYNPLILGWWGDEDNNNYWYTLTASVSNYTFNQPADMSVGPAVEDTYSIASGDTMTFDYHLSSWLSVPWNDFIPDNTITSPPPTDTSSNPPPLVNPITTAS